MERRAAFAALLLFICATAASTPLASSECFVDRDGAQLEHTGNQHLFRCDSNHSSQRHWASSIHVTDMPHHNRTFVRAGGESDMELARRICE